MLYKIMLVDDEEEVRESIIRKMDWDALGFHIVGDAENGQDALEKIHILEPDVIITDIQMPYMDGLELAEKVRARYPEKEVVIFSGYNDFEYAKQAMKCGITEYILKPVNSEELAQILARLKDKMDTRLEEQRDIRTLRESYRRNFPVLREKFLSDWMNGKLTKEELREKLEEYVPDIRNGAKWIAAAFYIEETPPAGERAVVGEKSLYSVSAERIIDEYLGKSYCFQKFTIRKGIGVLLALGEEQEVEQFLLVADQIEKACRQIFGLSLSIGVGNEKPWLRQLPQSFWEAKEAVGYCSSADMGKVVYIRDVEPAKQEVLILEMQDKNDLVHAVKFEDGERIRECLSVIFGRMEEEQLYSRQAQSYVISVLNSILELVWSNGLDAQEIFGCGVDCYEEVLRVQSVEEARELFARICADVHTQIVRRRTDMTVDIVKEAKEYISRNYADPELSVEMLCGSLHLSQSYFSTVFKKETGQTYISYLTDVRLNKAVELLNQTDDKTYVIAAKVGYPEPNYFSYVFKKKFGVSPSKYKGKLE